MLQGQRLYRRMITRFLPALAVVPDTHTLRPVARIGISGAPPVVSASHAGGLWPMLPAGVRWRVNGLLSRTGIHRAWGRGLALASGGWLGTHDRGMYAHYDQVLRHDPALFRGVLESPALLEPYFDPAGVKRLLDAHLRGRTNAAIALTNLWTYARWRQYLGAGDAPGN